MGTERKKQILLGVFIMALLLANTLGSKITEFPIPDWLAWPFNIVFFPIIWLLNWILTFSGNTPMAYNFFNIIHVSVGILTVPVMALTTDVVSEVFGKKECRNFVKTGVFVMLLMIAVTYISVIAPPAERFTINEAYQMIFGTTIRIAIASILAFSLSELNDIWTFMLLRKKTKGKLLWLRTGVSNAISEAVDTVVFMFVAFYDPATFPTQMVIKLIIPYYIFKFLMGFINIPFTYAGVWWARKGLETEAGKN